VIWKCFEIRLFSGGRLGVGKRDWEIGKRDWGMGIRNKGKRIGSLEIGRLEIRDRY
jgi:hypothetical protein